MKGISTHQRVFKIEVFNALQNTPLSKQAFKTQPQIKNEDGTWSPQYNLSTTIINKCRALSLQEVELHGWFLMSSHRTGDMYHIIHTQVWYEFCISFLYSWIDVLDLNEPFNRRVDIWEPFKMKFIWGLQSWILAPKYELNVRKIEWFKVLLVDVPKSTWKYGFEVVDILEIEMYFCARLQGVGGMPILAPRALCWWIFPLLLCSNDYTKYDM